MGWGIHVCGIPGELRKRPGRTNPYYQRLGVWRSGGGGDGGVGSVRLKPESPGAMGTACPARPLREKFRSDWHDGLQLLLEGGARRQPDPRSGDKKGSRRGGGWVERRPTEPRRAWHSQSPSFPSLEGPGCESPDPRRVPRLSSSPDPRSGDPHPGGRVRGPPPPPSLRSRTLSPPSLPTDALENSAPTRLSWWRAAWAFTLEWGGIQGPRRPQLPGAPGCTTASPRSPSAGSRPAARAGEEPRPRPVQPRPIRAAPGSPPQRLWLLNECLQNSADPSL